MSDESALNVKFVALVRKYPCIYDYSRLDHSKKVSIEKAWRTIGAELGLSVTPCKEKWKNLRTAFSRSMKRPPTRIGANRRFKDYYLKEVMQFVLPFMKIRNHTRKIPSIECVYDNSNDSESEFDASPLDDSSQKCDPLSFTNTSHQTVHEASQETPQQQCEKLQSNPKNQPTTPISTANGVDKSFSEYNNFKKASDLEFLKSLLPDISKMNDYQKRQFKKCTLDIIDSILCDAPPQNTNERVPNFTASNYSGHSCANDTSTQLEITGYPGKHE